MRPSNAEPNDSFPLLTYMTRPFGVVCPRLSRGLESWFCADPSRLRRKWWDGPGRTLGKGLCRAEARPLHEPSEASLLGPMLPFDEGILSFRNPDRVAY